MIDIYKNTEEYNPNKKRKILIVFDDMIANILRFLFFYYRVLLLCGKKY